MKPRRLLVELITIYDIEEGCFIEDCDRESGVELAVVKVLDPIEHEDIYVMVCPDHMEWVERRNDLVDDVYEGFRECRATIGQEYADRIDALDEPEFEEIDTKAVLASLQSEI